MARQYPASKTQIRALEALSLEAPRGYNDAAALLEQHGWLGNGSRALDETDVVYERSAPAARESWYQKSKRYHAEQREAQLDEEDADRIAFADAEARITR